MVRPADEEMVAIEKSQIQRGKEVPHCEGPYRERPGSVRRQRGQGGKCGQESVSCFPWEGTGEAGKAGLGLASFQNNIRGLGGVGDAPACLFPGPGGDEGKRILTLRVRAQWRMGWGAWALDWLVCI